MSENNRIDIKSERGAEFSTKLVFEGERYIVETSMTEGRTCITSMIFRNGEIIETLREGLEEEALSMSLTALYSLMDHHHQSTLDILRERLEPKKSPQSYLDDARTLLRRKNYWGALELAEEGLEHYPEEPFLLSVYGYLSARALGKYDKAINCCKKAIKLSRRRVPSDPELLYPSLFLNLGKVYLEKGDRRNAISIYQRVLDVDGENTDFQMELRRLGIRRRPIIPFLGRSNPINRVTGALLNWMKAGTAH
jgi:tetratricopeptide (TPR) repeat protein